MCGVRHPWDDNHVNFKPTPQVIAQIVRLCVWFRWKSVPPMIILCKFLVQRKGYMVGKLNGLPTLL